MSTKEKQKVAKEDVGAFPPTDGRQLALLKPPASLLAPQVLSEAEKAFLAEANETPSGPTKLPTISINHKRGEFIMPSGEPIDGQDGIQGFFLAHFVTRTYYERAFDPSAAAVPPDCSSIDSIVPVANAPHKQNHDCATCPKNSFGTAKVGKGKACKEYIRLFVVNPEFGDPPIAMLTLPPTSISKFYGGQMMLGGKRGYLDQLKAKHRAWQIVWNKITLTREIVNGNESTHCIPEFEMGDVASLEVAKVLATINNQYMDAIKRARAETPVEMTKDDAN